MIGWLWTRIRLGRRGGGGLSVAGFDHAAWDGLLQKYVDAAGLVAYQRWRADAADRDRLDDYLAELGRIDPREAAPAADRLAFWLNAYNAVTVAAVLREPPDGCGCSRRPGPLLGYRRWRDVRLWVGDSALSPHHVEHRILRPMGEPRVHFGLVCGARGCPPLRGRAYTAAGVVGELEDNARRFFARPDAFCPDAAARTVYLSRLLKWYARDFGPDWPARLRSVRPYLPDSGSLDWLETSRVRVAFLPYDWSLNESDTACRLDLPSIPPRVPPR